MADYISNVDFTRKVMEHKFACEAAEAEGKEVPIIPKDVAQSFILLATKLAYRPNFSGYSYKDEMISDAIVVCLNKVRNFDIAITQNAFGYFTQLCWYAFINRIELEKQEAYIKAKSFYMSVEENGDPFQNKEDMEDHQVDNNFMPYFDVEEFEKKENEKRAKARRKVESTTATLDDSSE